MSLRNAIVDKSLKFNPWNQKSQGELKLLTSPLLEDAKDVVHAFTTRLGGSSQDPYHSFNLGRHVKDEVVQEDALTNRAKLCEALGLDFERIAIPGQVHSATVRVVDDQSERPSMKEVDGLVTGSKDLPLLLHFADCVPVIVYDRVKKKAGIFHAGWKGTAQAIVARGVELMVSTYGCCSEDMVAAIGPAIGRCCYPTGGDVVEKLKQTVDYPDHLFGEANGQPCPDLKAINAMQLFQAGLKEIDISDWCTACNPEIFYSHRQSGGITGRQGAIVALK